MQSSSTSGREKARRPKSSDDGPFVLPGGPLDIENRLSRCGIDLVAGVDEAGRGPLAGPVVAAAVILRPGNIPPGIRDSKLLSAGQRRHLFQLIMESAAAVGVGAVGARAIDYWNISQAALEAMTRAVNSLEVKPQCLLVDGNRLPEMTIPVIGVVGGDRRCPSVAAASIIAKVIRDRFMERMDRVYPRYGFGTNKGYGTRAHFEALKRYGPSRVHRYSFEPVSSMLEGRP